MSAVLDHVSVFGSRPLPSGWQPVTLEDIVSYDGVFVDGDWVESKDQDPAGDVRLIQLADIGDGEYRNRSERFLTSEKAAKLGCTLLEPGDLLVARMPDPLGRACIFPGDQKRAVTVVDVAIVRPRNTHVNTRWLMYCINAPQFRRVVGSLQSGSTRQRISRRNLAKIVFALPPLDWQDETVAEVEKQFSRIDQAVANLKRVKADLKRYKAAILKAAVEGSLVPTEAELARSEGRGYETGEQLLKRILQTRRGEWKGKGNYNEPAAAAARMTELPEGWVFASVDQLLAHVTDGDHQPPPQTVSGIPFLVIGDVRSGEVDFSDTRFVSAEYYKSLDPLRRPQEGDLLYTLVGSYGIPVRVATSEAFCVQRHIAILRPHSLSPTEYLAWAMSSGLVFGQATEVATGTAQLTVPLAGLRRIAVPLPPTREQERIAAEVDRRLSIVRAIEAQVDVNLKRARALRDAVLFCSLST